MPNMNHTGPQGKGPGTGRGLGACSRKSFAERLMSMGKGMGWRRRAGNNTAPDAKRS